MILGFTIVQALLTIVLYFSASVDMAICTSAFLGLTGGRQAYMYLYLTDIVPMTHISFVSMWFCGSIALAVLVQDTYFYFYPHYKYFLLFQIGFGVLISLAGSCILVESPMQLLLNGDSTKATRSLEYIRNKNNLRSRQFDLYDLHKRIRLG